MARTDRLHDQRPPLTRLTRRVVPCSVCEHPAMCDHLPVHCFSCPSTKAPAKSKGLLAPCEKALEKSRQPKNAVLLRATTQARDRSHRSLGQNCVHTDSCH